ncbi:Xaa-Pro aminopeptidase [Histomonas meleagridis]|uniref:Xaa-Pro aminopeptidase n=1 Tax=Histomonas meleagridis TaxID=135588 RepID=UPI00355A0088|nr:Xaa-Pro aminopeptidase [Histomonas meleagridis]KAH0797454.1 Xaa-Pro aminopeptidase [Histomonas meleagridis]
MKKELVARRNKLYELLPKGSMALIFGREVLHLIPSIPIPFDQHSDYFYLTGQKRPGGALAIYNEGGKAKSALFLSKENSETMFYGPTLSLEEVKSTSGVDSIFFSDELSSWASKHNLNHENVYCSYPKSDRLFHIGSMFKSLSPYVDSLRVIKSKYEINLMKKASQITIDSFPHVIQTIKPGDTEKMVVARFENAVIERGASGTAYPTLALFGKNATYLHSINSNDTITEGQSLLLDGGAEVDHYASDFTRTVCIGKVSEIHSDTIKCVESVKNDLVKIVKNGEVETLNQLKEIAKGKLLSGLNEIGLKMDMNSLSYYFLHHTSHWVGLDVHDARSINFDRKLEKGMAFSVEPGLYFNPRFADCPKELRNVGIRFEDTVILE